MTEGKKALFLDMDGTTLNSKNQIPEENVRALQRCIEAGHEVVVTTGRAISSAGGLLKNYGLDQIGCRYLIAVNGGAVLDVTTGEYLYRKTIPLDQMRELILRAREQNIYLQTYTEDAVLTEREDENLYHYIRKSKMPYQVVEDLAAALKEEPCKGLAIDIHDPEPLKRFMTDMEEWASDKLDMFLSCREYMEIVPKGINKGNALRAFCDYLGIPVENSVAAGDEDNDLPMLLAAGVGCAVANARTNVKEAADYVTERDNDQAAIEEIVERFML